MYVIHCMEKLDSTSPPMENLTMFEDVGSCDNVISIKFSFADVVLVITKSAVYVYCNPLNYPHLLPYIAHWPNLRLHCTNQQQVFIVITSYSSGYLIYCDIVTILAI